MAVKKTTTKAAKAAPKKAAVKKAAPKKAAVKKAAPKAAEKKAPKKAAPKKKAALKLTDKQLDILKKVKEAKEGYSGAKAEGRILESLQTKKLIKKGAKDKASGVFKYAISKAGEKHLSAPAPSPSPAAPTA
jgi:hypothetical protein